MNNIFTSHDPGQLIWQLLIPLLLLGSGIVVAWSPLKKFWAHSYLQRLIKHLGQDSLRHFSLMDGADMPLYIEYLILQPDGLLMLIVKPYRGNIFAAEKIENWTQVIRHHSFKFPNPLHELDTNLQALKGMFPKLKLKGMVVFTQGASFPKDKPRNVYDFEQLKALSGKSEKREVPESLRQAWLKLREAAQVDKNLHPVILYQRGDKRRLLLGIFLLITCLIYTAGIFGLVKGVI
ncbi:MAG: nuclease-related domain-containing protein [Gammaproteobacteria bacterium]|jgi:hypothetical protein